MEILESWTNLPWHSWPYCLLPVSLYLCLGLSWVFYFTCKAWFSRKSSSTSPSTRGSPLTTVMKTKDLTVSLYYLHYSDLPVLYEMERTHGGNMWPCTFETFYQTLTNGNVVGVAAKDQFGRTHGYAVFGIRQEDVFLASLVVVPSFRRHGLGSAMVEWLVEAMPQLYPRPKLVTYAREGQLSWQTFLKKHGFTCTMIMDDLFFSPEENGYYFERPVSVSVPEGWEED